MQAGCVHSDGSCRDSCKCRTRHRSVCSTCVLQALTRQVLWDTVWLWVFRCVHSPCKAPPCFHDNDSCHMGAWALFLSVLHGKQRPEALRRSEIYGLLTLHPSTGTGAGSKLSWLPDGAHCHPQLLAGKLKRCMRCASALHCACPLPRRGSKQQQQLSAQCRVPNPFRRPPWPVGRCLAFGSGSSQAFELGLPTQAGQTDVRHNCRRSAFPARLQKAVTELKPITPNRRKNQTSVTTQLRFLQSSCHPLMRI